MSEDQGFTSAFFGPELEPLVLSFLERHRRGENPSVTEYMES